MQWSDEKRDENVFLCKTALLLLAVALNALEFFIPRIPFLPWLKPGLANIVTIVWIVKYGTMDALVYTLLRSWISGFYFGFSFITLGLSLSGGIVATLSMGLAWRYLGKRNIIGTIGIGITGAVFHNLGQLATVYFTIARSLYIFYQLPFMLIAALIAGSFVGFLSQPLARVMNDFSSPLTIDNKKYTDKSPSPVQNGLSIILLLLCVALLFIDHTPALILTAATVTAVSLFTNGFTLKTLFHPFRFWMLFAFIAIVYLFFSYGTRISAAPIITREGVEATIEQSLRLWAWLQAGLLLSRCGFHLFFMNAMRKVFPRHTDTLLAGVLALEFFPEVIRFARSRECRSGLRFFKAPVEAFSEFFNRINAHIITLLSEN